MISIIIPVYNGEKYLRRAIDSVIVQKGEWELIIVNDHSTDNTSAILAEFVSGNARIRVVNSESKGVTEARLTGARAALGKYLFFMDADDELPSDIIGVIHNIISSDSSPDIVISDITDKSENGINIRQYGDKRLSIGKQLFDWIIDNRTGFLWGKAIRKDLYLSLEYVPSELKFCEDYIQMLQISIKADRVKHAGISGYIYYQNPDSACNSVKSRKEYAIQFYKLAVSLKKLLGTRLFKNSITHHGIKPEIRIKIMVLYYLRLYLAVMGGWGKDIDNLRADYCKWMKEFNEDVEPTYTKQRRSQTIAMYYVPWLFAGIYILLLKYKYHRIK